METQDIYNSNEFNELDDLRQQINDLKSKVDQQGHLNEDLVKETIKGKMNDVHRTLTKLGIVALATIPLIIFNKFYIGLSWPLTIVTIALLVAFLISDYLVNKIDVSHMGDDMIQTANKLVKMQKNRIISRNVSYAIGIPWAIWYCYEFFMLHFSDGATVAWGGIVAIVIGIIVGLIVGQRLFNKMQRTNDEMIDQIKELSNE